MLALTAVVAAALALPLSVNGQQVAINSYRPVNVTCPNRSLLRNAGTSQTSNQTLNPQEASYVQRLKSTQIAQGFQTYLSRHDTGYNLSALAPNSSYWPNVGIAASGGGFRAALVGAGVFDAFDGRNATAVSAGTGGILQTASYMTGLSGGSWFVSSMAVNNFPAIQDLVLGGNGKQGWFLEYNLVLPDGITGIFNDKDYYDSISMNVELKENAGFNVSITDVWGVALAYHFGPGGTTADNFYNESQTQHNTPTQWSAIRNTSYFQNYSMPFPAIVADSRPPNYYPIALNLSTVYIPLNSTVYEFNPYDFGSWDAGLAHFVELDYVGTNLVNGQPYNSTGCINGFSNFGYTIGTSSSLFNAIIQTANATLLGLGDGNGLVESLLDDLLAGIGSDLRDSEDDLAIYPNPFQGINPGVFPRSNDDGLQLVDGGEAGANIPLDPLLVKARHVDTIIAIDASADTDQYWPNGTSLRASYARSKTLLQGEQTLPYFPSAETFVSQRLNQRPTFFGCNATVAEIAAQMPLVIYIPNRPQASGYQTNVSTYTLEYSRSDAQSFLNSMYNTQILGYNTSSLNSRDSQYGVCMACALVERRRQAANITRTSQCNACMQQYCYDAAPSNSTSSLTALGLSPDSVYDNDEVMHIR